MNFSRIPFNLRVRALFVVLAIVLAGAAVAGASAAASAFASDTARTVRVCLWSVWAVEMLLYAGMCLLLYRHRTKELAEARPETRAAEAKRLKIRYAVTGSVFALGLGLVSYGLQSNLAARMSGAPGPEAESSPAYLLLKTAAVTAVLVLLVLNRRNRRRS